MLVLCAWCIKEGKGADEALIGEKPPLEDTRLTHGICAAHRKTVEARFREMKEDAERTRKEAERQRDIAGELERLVDP